MSIERAWAYVVGLALLGLVIGIPVVVVVAGVKAFT
jgi:hypothetical protein